MLILLLGALGLLNISLVTVKHRIREIGIRRSFGATGGRVFFSVMMESVVATFVAGVVGVMLAILLVKNAVTETFVAAGVQDMPPFPVEAALIGLGAATARRRARGAAARARRRAREGDRRDPLLDRTGWSSVYDGVPHLRTKSDLHG